MPPVTGETRRQRWSGLTLERMSEGLGAGEPTRHAAASENRDVSHGVLLFRFRRDVFEYTPSPMCLSKVVGLSNSTSASTSLSGRLVARDGAEQRHAPDYELQHEFVMMRAQLDTSVLRMRPRQWEHHRRYSIVQREATVVGR